MQAHFSPSGTRSEQEFLEGIFLHGASFFWPTRDGPRPTHSGPQGKSVLCVQRVERVIIVIVIVIVIVITLAVSSISALLPRYTLKIPVSMRGFGSCFV